MIVAVNLWRGLKNIYGYLYICMLNVFCVFFFFFRHVFASSQMDSIHVVAVLVLKQGLGGILPLTQCLSKIERGALARSVSALCHPSLALKGLAHDFCWSGKTHLSSSEAKKYIYISKQITKSL